MRLFLLTLLGIFYFASCTSLTQRSLRHPSNLGAQIIEFPKTGEGEPLYGMELTLTSEKMKEEGRNAGGSTIDTDANELAQKKLIEKIAETCDGCELSYKKDKYGIRIGRLTYPDGYYFDVTLDPWVVEVTGKPIKASDLIEVSNRIQRDIYDNARILGYQPSAGAGGGHVHFGQRGLFGTDAFLFRDFMVDIYNHSELGSGILNFDHANSPPIHVLPEKSHRAFYRVIDEFDAKPGSLKGLATAIYNKVHKKTVMNWSPATKYHGVNLSRLVEKMPYDQRTVELRFIRPQQSGAQFKLIAELITKRIEYLKIQRQIGIIPQLISNHPETLEDKFNHFVKFIEETGDPAEKYFRLLPGEYGDLSWNFIENKYPNDPGKLWVFLLEFAEDVPYDEDVKANFILNKLESLDVIGPNQEKVMGTVLERSHDSPFFGRLQRILSENSLWSESRTSEVFKDYLSKGKAFHKNCRQLMLDIMMPFPRTN